MLSYEICEIFKSTYFEEYLRTPAFSSPSFKLDLVDLTVFPDLNLKYNIDLKLSLFLRQYVYQIFHFTAATLLLSYVIKFEQY